MNTCNICGLALDSRNEDKGCVGHIGVIDYLWNGNTFANKSRQEFLDNYQRKQAGLSPLSSNLTKPQTFE